MEPLLRTPLRVWISQDITHDPSYIKKCTKLALAQGHLLTCNTVETGCQAHAPITRGNKKIYT